MGVREKLNASPVTGGVIALALVAIAAAGIWWGLKPKDYGPPTQAFYTFDDGKNLFQDDAGKPASFTKDGQLAVRAHVYTCDEGKTQFVAYLERLPEGMQAPPVQPVMNETVPVDRPKNEAEARALAAKQSPRPKLGQFFTLVRKPGDKNWLKPGDSEYFPTITPKCSDATAKIDRVFP